MAGQRSLFSACVKLVDMARQDGKQRHFSSVAPPNRDESIAGHNVVEELSTENVCRTKKTCCSRHVGSSLFQFLGVTRHVPFMVWRDGPEWSDDSVVSCGGVCLDRRLELQYHVRSVCGCWTTGNKTGGWCECGHVLDTQGERHVPRSRTWKRRGRGQRGGLPPTVCESVPKDLRRKSESGHTCLRGHSSRQGSSGNSRRTP